MKKIVDNCVGCPPEIGCIGGACPHRATEAYFCDWCGEYMETVYDLDGEEICEDCLKKNFFKLEI